MHYDEEFAGFTTEFELPDVNEKTLARMREVEFYLTFQSLYSILATFEFQKTDAFIQSLADVCGIEKPDQLFYFFSEMRKTYARPTIRDIVITLRFMGLSYGDINRNFGYTNATISKYVKMYIKENTPSLFPKLDPMAFDDLDNALDKIQKFFLPFGRVCEVLYRAKKTNS